MPSLIDKPLDTWMGPALSTMKAAFFPLSKVFFRTCQYLYLPSPSIHVLCHCPIILGTHEKTHHFNGIQFVMKLWKKDTLVTSISDENFKSRDLVDEVILLAQKVGSCNNKKFPKAHR
jgi:hypothetical protein